MVLQVGDASFETVGGPPVVGVEEGDELTTSDSERGIASRGRTGVQLLDQLHAAGREVTAHNRHGPVGRPVVDDDRLALGVRLREHRFDRLADEWSGLEGGNYHRTEGPVVTHDAPILRERRNDPSLGGLSRRAITCTGMYHVITVHWLSDKWIEPQLRYLERYMPEHRVFASLNGLDPKWNERFFFAEDMPGKHGPKLNALAEIAHEHAKDDDYLVFIDGDALPIAPVTSDLLGGTQMVAVRRDENLGEPQPHPSFCITPVGFWFDLPGDWRVGYAWTAPNGEQVADSGGNVLEKLIERSIPWKPLLRSNRVNLDPLWFGVYGDVVYHHGAGFRPMKSRHAQAATRSKVRSASRAHSFRRRCRSSGASNDRSVIEWLSAARSVVSTTTRRRASSSPTRCSRGSRTTRTSSVASSTNPSTDHLWSGGDVRCLATAARTDPRRQTTDRVGALTGGVPLEASTGAADDPFDLPAPLEPRRSPRRHSDRRPESSGS